MTLNPTTPTASPASFEVLSRHCTPRLGTGQDGARGGGDGLCWELRGSWHQHIRAVDCFDEACGVQSV